MEDNTKNLIDKVIKAATYIFKDDQTAPGLTISSLKNKQYYCSIVRYNGAFAKGKEVVTSCKNTFLDLCLKDLAFALLKKQQSEKNPLQELEEWLVPKPLDKKWSNESIEKDFPDYD